MDKAKPNSRPRGVHPTKDERLERIQHVYDLLVEGKSSAEIEQFCAKKWGVKPRAVHKYREIATKWREERRRETRAETYTLAMERLELLFKRALEEGDIRGALAVQREINTLAGLYPPRQVAVNHHWRTTALESIRNGELDYQALSEVLGDSDLAMELFREAGVKVHD